MSQHSRLVIASLLLAVPLQAQRFADRVIDYIPGNGFATDFVTGAGFTNLNSILGGPSTVTPGPFGGPVDPFNPPYLSGQLLSIGVGGTVTVQFDSAVLNHPDNPFGIDFLVFGNSGFVITNGNFSGGGVTDGSLFGSSAGPTRVSVSADNQTYYELSGAPTVDGLYPTLGSGDPSRPVAPTLTLGSFSGAGLPELERLYDGSAGGTGFDLSWARDAAGQPVPIDSIHFVRVDVLGGSAEIDAITVVPEPGALSLILLGLSVVLGRLTYRRRDV
jgi:hypothetical protein